MLDEVLAQVTDAEHRRLRTAASKAGRVVERLDRDFVRLEV
jgi:hypothetical protein